MWTSRARGYEPSLVRAEAPDTEWSAAKHGVRKIRGMNIWRLVWENCMLRGWVEGQRVGSTEREWMEVGRREEQNSHHDSLCLIGSSHARCKCWSDSNDIAQTDFPSYSLTHPMPCSLPINEKRQDAYLWVGHPSSSPSCCELFVFSNSCRKDRIGSTTGITFCFILTLESSNFTPYLSTQPSAKPIWNCSHSPH